MKIGIVGLGLMGGSFALDIKIPYPNSVIYGLDMSKENLNKALELGIIDHQLEYSKISEMDLVLVAVPVNYLLEILPKILDTVGQKTLVIDLGSTKEAICSLLENHSKRSN